jgi:formylglycine-generating enzyme required for sulfatase activity
MNKRLTWVMSAVLFLTAGSAHARRNVAVVDFGDDYCWHGGTQGLPTYRGGTSAIQLFRGSPAGDSPVDVSGDGTTDRDSIAYYEFSMDEPFNPDGSFYNIRGNNPVFYGGAVTFWANRRPNWQEGGINIDHELRDDFNLHSYATEGGNVALRTFGVWLWKKEDFRNGGDRFRVSSDEDSRIAVYISRYWKDYEEARFVIQDGNEFFISEIHPLSGATHTLYEMKLSGTRWAKYEPRAPFHVEFDPSQARFAHRTFNDIQACGWYVAKPTLSGASLWLKWYSFSLSAVVNRPEAASYLLNMQPIPGGGRAITAAPVSYAEWRQIYAWSNRNQFGMFEGYVFDRDGDMGDMFLSDAPVSAAEPVTDITWLDALAWCNALSEYEGLEPVFHTDAEFGNVLRVVMDRQRPGNEEWRPDVHVNWAANGFRPATEAERPSGAKGLFVVRGPAAGSAPRDANTAIADWRARYVPLDVSAVAGDPNIKLIAIPGGEYTRRDGAITQIKPFFLAETETTFAQWRRVYAWAVNNGYTFDRDGDIGSMDWSDPDTVFTHNQPVTQISHNDIMIWCNALSEMQGLTPVYYSDPERTEVYRHPRRFRIENTEKGPAHFRLPDRGVQPVYIRWEVDGYRMPTPWEWEYAYRAGNNEQNVFPWSGGDIGDHAWYGENSGERTHPVKQKQPNPWGLYDMAGNVFEWTMGGGDSYYIVDNPRGEGMPIAMGGSFRTLGREVDLMLHVGGRPRVAIKSPMALAYPEIGFRVARYEAGTHPVDPPVYVPAKVLDFDPSRLDAN